MSAHSASSSAAVSSDGVSLVEDVHAVPADAHLAQRQAVKNLIVGFVLAVGTVANVALAYAPLGSVTAHVVVALSIVAVECFLVAFISMHLKDEKASILRDVLLSIVFVIALIGLSLLAFTDRIHL
jgi:heme/copper-type cytochrome/quinol oxidase subunit 4